MEFYTMPKDREDELRHYGILGMKWGRRKSTNSVNKNYTAKQRKRDRAFYGDRAEKRINKKLNQGHGLQGARHYEAERKERKEKRQRRIKKGVQKTTRVLSKIGTMYVTDQLFLGGHYTNLAKQTVKKAGRAAVSAYVYARGGRDIRWYD